MFLKCIKTVKFSGKINAISSVRAEGEAKNYKLTIKDFNGSFLKVECEGVEII